MHLWKSAGLISEVSFFIQNASALLVSPEYNFPSTLIFSSEKETNAQTSKNYEDDLFD